MLALPEIFELGNGAHFERELSILVCPKMTLSLNFESFPAETPETEQLDKKLFASMLEPSCNQIDQDLL